MNLKKVHHIAIIGSNYEQSKHFYVDLLGFSIIRENYRPERDDYKIDLQLDGIELELFIIKNCPKRPSYPEAYGLRHLAFAVDSVENTVRELNKRGIITEPIRFDIYTGKKMTFFYDPDKSTIWKFTNKCSTFLFHRAVCLYGFLRLCYNTSVM